MPSESEIKLPCRYHESYLEIFDAEDVAIACLDHLSDEHGLGIGSQIVTALNEHPRIAELEATVERYRVALEHYASDGWMCRYDGLAYHRCNSDCAKTTLRGGHGFAIAAAALKGE